MDDHQNQQDNPLTDDSFAFDPTVAATRCQRADAEPDEFEERHGAAFDAYCEARVPARAKAAERA